MPNHKKTSLLLYSLSLVTPVFFGSWSAIGLMALGFGWMGVFALEPTIGLPWLANIVYFICLALPAKHAKAKVNLSYATLLLGAFAIGITEIPVDEGGGSDSVIPGIGMMLWLASFGTLLMHNQKQLSDNRTNRSQDSGHHV